MVPEHDPRIVVTPSQLPRKTSLWTRDTVLMVAGFDPTVDLRLALQRHREALSAEKDGAPDHRTRLDAVELMYRLGGVRDIKLDDPEAAPPALTLTIVTGSQSQTGVKVETR
jgi:hypothetical protein